MNTKKVQSENVKTYSDLTNKSWYFADKESKIKIGNNFSEIQEGKVSVIEVKEILFGQNFQTWKIVIDKEDKIYLLKTSRELK